MIARYGDAESFKRQFDPIRQARLCRDVDRIFTGTAPPLGRISMAYGVNVTESLVMFYVRDLCEYTGVKEKMTPLQMHEVSAVIVSEYSYLTIAEIMYFFYLFKAGRFGVFYGAVDGLVITTAMREYLRVRDAELDRIERQQRKIRDAEEEQRRQRECCTFEEYEEIKWLLNMGYESPLT